MFYNKNAMGGYDELVRMYPAFYREVDEMEAIWKLCGSCTDGLRLEVEKVLDNSFIDKADSEMISRFEDFLGIPTDKNKPLEERRSVVLAFFAGMGKMSASLIAGIIKGFNVIGEPDIEFKPFDEAGNNELYISFSSGGNTAADLDALREILSRKLPAHIASRIVSTYEAEPSNANVYLCGGMAITECTNQLPVLEREFGSFDANVIVNSTAVNVAISALPTLSKQPDFKAQVNLSSAYSASAESSLPALPVEEKFTGEVMLSSASLSVSETPLSEIKEVN